MLTGIITHPKSNLCATVHTFNPFLNIGNDSKDRPFQWMRRMAPVIQLPSTRMERSLWPGGQGCPRRTGSTRRYFLPKSPMHPGDPLECSMRLTLKDPITCVVQKCITACRSPTGGKGRQ